MLVMLYGKQIPLDLPPPPHFLRIGYDLEDPLIFKPVPKATKLRKTAPTAPIRCPRKFCFCNTSNSKNLFLGAGASRFRVSHGKNKKQGFHLWFSKSSDLGSPKSTKIRRRTPRCPFCCGCPKVSKQPSGCQKGGTRPTK